jgi:hypothetical protein
MAKDALGHGSDARGGTTDPRTELARRLQLRASFRRGPGNKDALGNARYGTKDALGNAPNYALPHVAIGNAVRGKSL